jgi:hypothetical protein
MAPSVTEAAAVTTSSQVPTSSKSRASLGFVGATVHLFTAVRFRIHRVFGLLYLLQFFSAVFFELCGTPMLLLFWTMPLTGIIQSIIAANTFTFLKGVKNDKVQGTIS